MDIIQCFFIYILDVHVISGALHRFWCDFLLRKRVLGTLSFLFDIPQLVSFVSYKVVEKNTQ